MPDFDSMSLEELDKLMADGVVESDPEEAPDPQPEVSAVPAVEEVPAAPEEPAPEEPPPSDLDILRAEMEELKAKAKHWEEVAGRNGGRVGWLERQIGEFAKARAAAPEEASYEESREPSAPAAPRTDDFALWAVKKAAQSARDQFIAAHPDYAPHLPELANYLQAIGYDGQSVLATNNPEYVETEFTRVFREHKSSVDAVQAAKNKELLLERRADSTRRLQEAKTKATVSGSGGTPPPKLRPKTFNEMTLEELDAAMQQSTGGRW
jgi:hypothetical protein